MIGGRKFVLNKNVSCDSSRVIFAVKCNNCQFNDIQKTEGVLKDYGYNNCQHTTCINIVPLFSCSHMSDDIFVKMHTFVKEFVRNTWFSSHILSISLRNIYWLLWRILPEDWRESTCSWILLTYFTFIKCTRYTTHYSLTLFCYTQQRNILYSR